MTTTSSSLRPRRLGLLGGTLDPIHYGHLDAAHAAQSALALDEVWFIPSHDPPHRPIDPRTSAYHRFAMTAMAIDGCRGFRASDVELGRDGPSYTVDTLRSLHAAGWKASQLFFIIGADAFAEIATWHEYPAILDESHFAVIARPGTTLTSALARTPALASRVHSWASEELSDGDTRIFLVEANTRNVSSTTIRQRIGSAQSIDDLVPPAVVRHISGHNLYKR